MGTMMMTQLYWIGSLLLLANRISTSEGNELEKTVNGIQGGEGMMMAIIAKTGKEDSSHTDGREDSMEDASSEKSVDMSDEDEDLSEEDSGKSEEDQGVEEELSEEDRGKSDEDQDSSDEVTREDLVPCSGPITNPALVGPSRDNCENPIVCYWNQRLGKCKNRLTNKDC